jgi:hypothetical protein
LIGIAAVILAVVAYWATQAIVREVKMSRDEAARGRMLAIMNLFAPAIAAAEQDPRALLVWHPLARTARQLFPKEFESLDRTAGAAFPFTAELVQSAHAQWSADWLAWERTHDATYKLKAAEAEHELAASGGAPFVRAKLDAIEKEKLDLYQRRYQEYVRVAKALQALVSQ